MNKKGIFKIIAVFSILIFLAGCGAYVSEKTDTKSASIRQLDRSKTTSVKTNFNTNQELAPMNLEPEVYGSECILKGSVPSQELKDLAQKIALKTPGVNKVKNEIKVEP
ncbi:MAG: BON domain-containing protein [Vulcanimicrobiota bacterium]